MLSCNPKKTKIVHCHSRFSHPLSYSSIKLIKSALSVRKLVIWESFLIATSGSQATSKVFAAQHSLALRNVGRIRKYLDQTSTERPVHAFLFKQTFCQLPVTDHRTSLILFCFDFSLSSLFLILKTISDRHRKFQVHLILVPFNLLTF